MSTTAELRAMKPTPLARAVDRLNRTEAEGVAGELGIADPQRYNLPELRTAIFARIRSEQMRAILTERSEYVAFGWHSFASASLSAIARDSVCHLAPAEQGDRPWEGICGTRMLGRSARRDHPDSVARDVRTGHRTLCKRCVAKAEAAK